MRTLFEAVKEGNEGEVRRLLDRGDPALLDIAMDDDGNRPLVVAAKHGHLGVVRLLIERGASADAMGASGDTALRCAAEEGHEETVAFLLGQGAQANIPGGDGMTPLVMACTRGHRGVVRLLVQHLGGQALHETHGPGWVVLHYAADGGHEATVAFLLGQGAEANVGDWEGLTPFMLACMHGDVGVVGLLLQHIGVEALQDRDHDRGTALHWAANAGREETVAFLLGQGAQANITGGDMTPLMLAACNGHMGVVRLLVQHMEEQALQVRDLYGRTALHVAAEYGRVEVVRFLLFAGADPTLTDEHGTTPRALAATGHAACVAVFEWWEGELQRRALLWRATSLHKAYTTQRDLPTSQVPTYLEARVAAGHAVPVVEVVSPESEVQQQAEEQANAASDKRRAAGEGGEAQGAEAVEKEEVHAVLAHMVQGLHEALVTELLEGFWTEK